MTHGFPTLFTFWTGHGRSGSSPQVNVPSGMHRLMLADLQLELEKSILERKKKLEPKLKEIKTLRKRVNSEPLGPSQALLNKLGKLETEVKQLSGKIDTDILRTTLQGVNNPPFIAYVRAKGLDKELAEAQRISRQAEDLQILAALKEVLK